MRHRRRLAVLAAAAAAATAAGAVALISTPAQADTNILTNPGFETGDLSGWTCDASASVGSGHAHIGSYALAGNAMGDTAQCAQTVSVTAGAKYTFTTWVNGSYVFIGTTGAVTTSTWTPGTGGNYQQLTLSFTPTSSGNVTVYVHGWYGVGTYYADDFLLTGPNVPPPPSSSPSATRSPSPSPSPSHSTSPSPSPSPSHSTSPSPSPTSHPPTGPLPKHELTGYWQDFYNGAKALRLSDVPTSYDLIAVAFANADPSHPGGVTFSVDSGLSAQLGGYSDADFRADIATVHARGQHVVLSVGGEKGSVSVSSSSAATNFANSMYDLISSYGFDGVDIDLENGVSPTYMAQALRSLSSRVGSNLIITMAPQTIDMQSTGAAYFQLALNIKDILTVVHTQYYNSGSMLGCDQMFAYGEGSENFLTALPCIQLQGGLRPDQVALGLPASSSAAGGGYTSPSIINASLDCLARGTNCGSFKPPATWPGIRGVMTWSINWDASNGYSFANSVKSHLNTLP